ncbi:hypothetical protein K6V78_11115 [Streptococcus gallolyticus]|nr:hypothetical protein [Streptococcus gallolyticus]
MESGMGIENIVYLHFTGGDKPWKKRYSGRYSDLYKYMQKQARKVVERNNQLIFWKNKIINEGSKDSFLIKIILFLTFIVVKNKMMCYNTSVQKTAVEVWSPHIPIIR